MKAQTTSNKNTINFSNLVLVSIAAIGISACSNSKSNNGQLNIQSFNSTTKVLADCSKAKNTDISINTSDVKDTLGNVDPNWVKVKFNYLSAAMTASGNTVRFFKWKVSGTQSYLDQSPLVATFYNLSSGQVISENFNNIPVSSLNTANGLYVMLNDPQAQYQALKIVVYNSGGKIIGQVDSLIPQFAAVPSQYAINSDGTTRADILQTLHPLYGTSLSGWTEQNIKDYFQAMCF